jgi:hypothetical protein
MGRSTNSFATWVGHALEINNTDKVTLPEKDLWIAVLTRAALDACKGPPHLNMTRPANVSHKNHWNYNQDQARHFFLEGGSHFNLICELAGRDPTYVQQRVRKIILRKNGWNVDVPVTSHYRSGRGRKRGRPRKNKLTGNSYYAAMGKKGGRPRMYNDV